MKRVFLGWERPLAETAAEWLWTRRAELSAMCLVVPTAQAGRRLQDTLAQCAAREDTALLGVRAVTPAAFIKVQSPDLADETIELLAWIEGLENIDDWSPYEAAFPHPLDTSEGKGWSRSLAQSFMELRYHLQENGMLIADVARRMKAHHDGARWQALARIEEQVESKLGQWKLQSRSAMLREKIQAGAETLLPNDTSQLVLIGVTETSPLVAECWRRVRQAYCLIAAPASEAEQFNDLGFPHLSWCQKEQQFPGRGGIEGEVHLVSDQRQLANQAVACAAASGKASDQVMLAVCDPQMGHYLATAFERAGWPTFDPGRTLGAMDWRVWMRHWQRWLSSPTVGVLSDLALFQETTHISGKGSYRWLHALGILRDQCLVESIDDVERMLEPSIRPRGIHEEAAQRLLQAIKIFMRWRSDCYQQGCCVTMKKLLERWQQERTDGFADGSELLLLLEKWQPWESRLSYDASFWMQLICDRTPAASLNLPDQRALDIEGWLEIAFHRSEYLLICGMSDEFIPARYGGEPWLNRSNRGILGLNTDEQREARDAYLYYAMMEAHRGRGRVDVILNKTDAQGKIQAPSRLFMRASGTELAERVAHLFAELPQADANLQWYADWRWRPRFAEVPAVRDGTRKLSITSLRDYLQCPYRFYLKHGLRMNQRDGDRGEWNPRDFGNVLHSILETWGRDPVARDFTDTELLTNYWHQELDRLIEQRHAGKPNLALQVQLAALRQRLEWLAEQQAEQRKQGWQVWKVEEAFTIQTPTIQLSGKVDRIDYHPEQDRYIMWDYKTGQIKKNVQSSHLKSHTARSVIPAHLEGDERLFVADSKGKSQRWINLQLPLYAAARLTPKNPSVGYITIGDAGDEVLFQEWQDFDQAISDQACACASWLIEMIDQRKFWPPTSKTEFDDFGVLSSGAELRDLAHAPPPAEV